MATWNQLQTALIANIENGDLNVKVNGTVEPIIYTLKMGEYTVKVEPDKIKISLSGVNIYKRTEDLTTLRSVCAANVEVSDAAAVDTFLAALNV